ncbi:MAG: AraC family transcriptional regulator [Clostridia bacterium]|nr:AraC family transcriptional regulator [Clostridia bacterium]
MNIEQQLQNQLLSERESTLLRDSYNHEIVFYDLIANGDIDGVNKWRNSYGLSKHALGKLSDNDVTNERYHGIVLVALISRFCIEAGMDICESYAISDIFIQRLDQLKTVKEIRDLRREIADEYCHRMHDMKKKNVVSRHIVLAIDYIREHIQDNLTVENIAISLSLNPSYLSKLFKQEMDITISQYIRKEKINIAQNMLRHLDESSLNIANFLGFSSQSHFIQVFKKETGYTPEDYRKKYYHQSWMGDEAEGINQK